MSLSLHVLGTPRPKQSARWVNGRPVSVVKTKKHLKIWTAAIVAACRRYLQDGGVPLAGPLAVTMSFYFASPVASRHGTPHTARPDSDNLAKAVLDAMQASGIMADDSKVADARQVKLWAPQAGLVVHARAFGAPEPPAEDDDDLGASAVGVDAEALRS